jgi:SufS family cysteine desulfurase
MLAMRTRKDFPIFSHEKELVYLDNAATTQKPLSVIESMTHYYSSFNANVGRGVYKLSMKSHDAYENGREVIRHFVNAPTVKNIIFTKGTTESVNFVAQSFAKNLLSPGDEILVTGMEHHSNLIPWQTICQEKGAKMRVVPVGKDGNISLDSFKEALNNKTKMVAVVHVSNVLGVVNPIKEMIALAHEKNIPVSIDGAQAIGHVKVDVQDLDADFYSFSAHKMYGPMGVGVLYVKDAHLDRLESFQTGGGIARGLTYDNVTDYMPAPHRFEAGTPNVAGVIGLSAAAKYMSEIGYEAIQEHEEKMFAHAVSKLVNIDGLEILGSTSEPTSIISFNIKKIHPYDIGNHLNKFDIAVRTGVHCAVPFVDSLGLVGTVRASFGIYNSLNDIDRLSDALGSAVPMDWSKDRPTTRFMA